MNITDSQDRWNQPTTAVTPKETGFPTALVIQIVLAIITYLITKAVSKADSIHDFADAVTMYNNVGSVLNSILETRAAAGLPTVLVTPFPKSELVNKCDMRISGKLQSAKLISSEGR